MEKIYTGNLVVTYDMGVRQKIAVRGTKEEVNELVNKVNTSYCTTVSDYGGFAHAINGKKIMFVDFEECADISENGDASR